MQLIESDKIAGVIIADLTVYGDERGSFRETFRKSWFPQRSWEVFQTNCSHSEAGVLRGLHYHFKQVDYWYVPSGTLRAALFDMRPNSPTYMATQTIDMGEKNDVGLFIPIGVAHGFAALTDVTLTYIVDNYFDGGDEYSVAWDDPALGIDWGLENPVVSERDQKNVVYAAVPMADRPK
ncbi:MAG: dTDP-4-dehydrorhamnose 3,5-epimerase family protein [Candidatus Promineifilaceae bacterium]